MLLISGFLKPPSATLLVETKSFYMMKWLMMLSLFEALFPNCSPIQSRSVNSSLTVADTCESNVGSEECGRKTTVTQNIVEHHLLFYSVFNITVLVVRTFASRQNILGCCYFDRGNSPNVGTARRKRAILMDSPSKAIPDG